MNYRYILPLLLMSFFCAVRPCAALEVADIFSDNMVLQRDLAAPVWGTAAAGTSVTVEFAGQSKTAVASADGTWRVALDPLSASAQPREMTVRATEAGKEQAVKFANVLVGEVWLCSGQSNMYWSLGKIGDLPGIAGSEDDLARADHPTLRLNSDADHPLCGGGWKVCTPDTARGFSATAFYFGRFLQQKLDVPVGLIHRSRGGSQIQSWMPADVALADPLIRHYHEVFTQNRAAIDAYNRAMAKYSKAANAWWTDRKLPQPVEPDPLTDECMIARGFARPGVLFERFIQPTVGYAMRGVIWYQGESNATSTAVSQAYRVMLESLIRSWRAAWRQGDFPFYIVQLPCWSGKEGTHWRQVRQAELDAYKSTPQTGLAVTVDISELDNLHPNNKREVGRRLANWALAKTYACPDVPFSGPIAKSACAQGDSAVVQFDFADGGLVAKGAKLTEFEIAGNDNVFYLADAVVSGNSVTVRSPAVAKPVAVRYGWKNVFTPSLFNAQELPASPFTLAVEPAK